MRKEHTHAELMRMYASDSSLKIQVFDEIKGRWENTFTPEFYQHMLYRVKPNTKKWRMYIAKDRNWPMVSATVDVEKELFFVAWLGDWVEQII